MKECINETSIRSCVYTPLPCHWLSPSSLPELGLSCKWPLGLGVFSWPPLFDAKYTRGVVAPPLHRLLLEVAHVSLNLALANKMGQLTRHKNIDFISFLYVSPFFAAIDPSMTPKADATHRFAIRSLQKTRNILQPSN